MTTRQQNDELYTAVVAGDDKSCKLMIEINQALVYVLLTDFLQAYPYLRYLEEDLITEARLGINKAVANMVGSHVKKPNPTGLIRAHIKFAFGDVLKRVKRTPESLSYASEDEPGMLVNDSCIEMVDLIDELQHKCEVAGIPWKMIDMKLQGYTDAEIGEEMGCSQQWVTQCRKRLKRLMQ